MCQVQSMEHAQQAIRLNDKVGAYYVLAAANAVGDQDLDRAREYCELVLKRGPKEFGTGPCKDALILQNLAQTPGVAARDARHVRPGLAGHSQALRGGSRRKVIPEKYPSRSKSPAIRCFLTRSQ